MATNPLKSLRHHHHCDLLKLQHSIDITPSSSLFLKPRTSTSTCLSLTIATTTTTTAFSVSPSTSTNPSTSQALSLDLLRQYLSEQNFRQADEETRRLLIQLSGEPAQKRGYVFFSEVQFISDKHLKAIDELWRQHSNNRFGYSAQKRIWEQKANNDFSKFFIKVGWMKKLDTEVEQYNYRSFPNEFMWELSDDTPEGHLPLTNALRGTQLLNSILNHPAFEIQEEEEEEEEDKLDDGNQNGGLKGLRDSPNLLIKKTVFKPDYSF